MLLFTVKRLIRSQNGRKVQVGRLRVRTLRVRTCTLPYVLVLTS